VYLYRKNKIYAWKNVSFSWEEKCKSSLFQNSNVLVLLDPRVSKKGRAEFTEGPRMLLVAASNNMIHFASSVKATSNINSILSVPTLKELKVTLPYMIGSQVSTVNIEEMLRRAKIVGPVLRYIISEDNFKHQCLDTDEATSKLDAVRDMLSDNGLTKNHSSLPGCTFTLRQISRLM
jgi:hypothetical protein